MSQAPVPSAPTVRLHALLAGSRLDPFAPTFLAKLAKLLEEGADPQAPNDRGVGAVHQLLTYSEGDTEAPEQALALCLRHGGCVHAPLVSDLIVFSQAKRAAWAIGHLPDPLPEGLLHDTVLWSNDPLRILPLLLDRGVDINAKDDNGSTILHLLNARTVPLTLELVEYCLLQGADVSLQNRIGDTVREAASPDLAVLLDSLSQGHELAQASPLAASSVPMPRRAP